VPPHVLASIETAQRAELDPDEIAVELRRSDGSGPRRPRRGSEPAPTIRGGGGGGCGTNLTVRALGNTKGGDRPEGLERGGDEPAWAVTTRPDQWEKRDPEVTMLDRRQNGKGGAVAPRPASAPAPTMQAEALRAGRDVWRDEDDPEASWTRERPAPTLTGSRRSKDGGIVGRQLPPGQGEHVGGRDQRSAMSPELKRDDWHAHRPATTLQGDQRIFQPGGHHANDGRASDPDLDGRSKNAVRVSVAEAAILQSFPADWPWQGNRTSQFQQIGNAVPPGLARPVLVAAMTPTRRRSS
jgi:site-specific DNA-cytosine methylase